MRLAVTDTETTGVEETDQVVEVAILTLEFKNRKYAESGRWSTLVKPTVAVSHGARAAHHITDRELANAPSMTSLLEGRGLPELGIFPEKESALAENDDKIVFCAHNAPFDRSMLTQSGVLEAALPKLTICTWKCAMHLFPDAQGHSNQTLRYALGIKVDMPKNLPPHRALPDAIVTAGLLLHMLGEGSTIESLIELTTLPVLLRKVRFGQNRGKLWGDMDYGFLRWVLSKDFDADVKHTARHYLDAAKLKR